MTTYELIEAYILTGQKIDVLWNFFVTIHLAIAGFILYQKPSICWQTGVMLIIAYFAFSFINYRAKDLEYQLLIALAKDIQEENINIKYNEKSTSNVIINKTEICIKDYSEQDENKGKGVANYLECYFASLKTPDKSEIELENRISTNFIIHLFSVVLIIVIYLCNKPPNIKTSG